MVGYTQYFNGIIKAKRSNKNDMKELRRQGTDLKMRILSGIYGFISKVVEALFDVSSTIL